VSFIKSSIQEKNPDKDVAAVVAKFKLTEKFTLADLQELQNAGVGPKTLTALASLVTQSANLNPPAPKGAPVVVKATGPPPPTVAEQTRILREARDWALSYVKSLPDFLCLEITNRSVDRHYRAGAEGSWSPSDRLIEKLTFFDHKENYELFQHNDTAVVNKSADSLGGARSTGEWASLLGSIFSPQSETDFKWVALKAVRTKPANEFHYSIEQAYSQETVAHGDKEKVITGFHGSVFIEKGTNVVLRITVTPEIPPGFPVQDVDQTVDYDYQDIGGQTFLLPLKSQVTMRDGLIGTRNEIEWRSYRKYSADTNIIFDTGDTPAADPKKDQPPPKK
jgi:hypothetical protein